MMIPFKSLFLFLYAVESDLFSLPPFCIENELNFLQQLVVKNPMKTILLGKFYPSTLKDVEQYFSSDPRRIFVCVVLL